MKRSSPNPSGKMLYSTAEDVLKFYGSPMIRKKRGAPRICCIQYWEYYVRSSQIFHGVNLLEKLNTMWRIALILLRKLMVWRYLFGQIVEAFKQIVRERVLEKPLVICYMFFSSGEQIVVLVYFP